ncbi:SelT/SelW/SelH family protein [Larsenimonas rhizosphaerae]|uniref:SelT/SelW/SelH family protein n=1 Tax=Larsenimonas rhizosphaerae TaxID=2944682 RepID=A0AA41ZMZ7_9GAMM|nr:SelT/SelW/SelH family protein [Larsenimonas rhizosphaerae]MCM2131821.1 SelT/SelW/SelH family protein [Larsenimonas rhizosphaerae]MCX2524863.1 SelT/SelW/SelH family protein [Larsenimonas rhizosphaerae]
MRITIHYCTQCHWLMRAAWYAQELLQTFGEDLDEVALAPSHGGHFDILANGELIWDRKRDNGFPAVKEIKRLVRDRLDPGRDLGHLDR